MTKYCPNCNAEMESDARFCPECGYATMPPQQVPTEAAASRPQIPNGAVPPQAQQIPNGGFAPQQPQQFPNAGFAPQQPQQIPNAGFAPQQPQQFPNTGFAPQQPQQFPNAGFAPQQPQQFPNGAFAPQQPQRSRGPSEAPQKTKKRIRKAPFIAVTAVILVVVLVLGFIKPGFFLKKNESAETLINRVEVFIPNPTGPEAVAGLVGNLAFQYYVEARLYLEKLSEYDLDDLDADAFRQLLSDTVLAFENAEKASGLLSETVDLWMECSDKRDKPTYKVIQKADGTAKKGSSLTITALADGPSQSEVRAEDIVAAFDKAKNGQKLKAVATLLGTDAKHAMVQLQMAQAELEKRGYDKIADQADTCVKVAKTLKTAGAIAGLAVAAAPLATGAVATMAAGEMLVTGTGVVVSAVNTGLDVVSTGAMYYYGTDQNQVSEAADAIADSKFMQTVNIVTGVAGVGYNIKNLIEKADMNNLSKYLTSLSSNHGKEGSDVFGLLSFGLSNLGNLPGPHAEAADTAMKTLVTMVTHTQEDGILVKIADTIMGNDEKKFEAVSKLLDEIKIPSGVRNLLESAVSLYATGEEPKKPIETDPAEPISEDLLEQLLSEREELAPGSTDVDLDTLISTVKEFMQELSSQSAPPETESETASPTEPSSDKTEPTAPPVTPTPGGDTSYEKVVGYYKCKGTQRDNMGDDHWETEEVSMSFNIKINNGRLVWASGYGEYYDEQVLSLDSATGDYCYSDNWDDVANEPSWFTEYGSFTFYQENGVKKVRIQIRQIDNEYGTVETEWELTGAVE